LAALMARKPDLARIEAALGAPYVDGYVLAKESSGWMTSHA
jgi:hypothetical protein